MRTGDLAATLNRTAADVHSRFSFLPIRKGAGFTRRPLERVAAPMTHVLMKRVNRRALQRLAEVVTRAGVTVEATLLDITASAHVPIRGSSRSAVHGVERVVCGGSVSPGRMRPLS